MKRLLNLPTGTLYYRIDNTSFVFLIADELFQFRINSFYVYGDEVSEATTNDVLKHRYSDKSDDRLYFSVGDDYIPYGENYNNDWFVFFVCDEKDYCKIKLLCSENLDTGLST